MSTQKRAWRPLFENDTVSAAVGVTAGFLAFPKTPFGTRAIRLVNVGTAIVFIEFTEVVGNATATTTNSIPILPNTVEVFTIANDEVGLSHIGSATGSTLYFTCGEGL